MDRVATSSSSSPCRNLEIPPAQTANFLDSGRSSRESRRRFAICVESDSISKRSELVSLSTSSSNAGRILGLPENVKLRRFPISDFLRGGAVPSLGLNTSIETLAGSAGSLRRGRAGKENPMELKFRRPISCSGNGFRARKISGSCGRTPGKIFTLAMCSTCAVFKHMALAAGGLLGSLVGRIFVLGSEHFSSMLTDFFPEQGQPRPKRRRLFKED
ncbi:hypothetical protein HPP92_006674 [Vanilla planifolia]|uniref:Uncharacterized protein n=1 Tax=Vanilla planifolia TaxID=51239 RepID=A0A835RKC8_VANPL|nr:hypothetical protein HPP92_006674 [Vanilla planifolia]